MKNKPTSHGVVGFAQMCYELRQRMQENIPLNETERLKVENSIALVQMGYVEWKLRNLPSMQTDQKKGAKSQVSDGSSQKKTSKAD